MGSKGPMVDRRLLLDLLSQGLGPSEIARRLGRPVGTVSGAMVKLARCGAIRADGLVDEAAYERWLEAGAVQRRRRVYGRSCNVPVLHDALQGGGSVMQRNTPVLQDALQVSKTFSGPLKTYSFRLRQDCMEHLRALADREGVDLSVVVRRKLEG